jgi:hypothetical protein
MERLIKTLPIELVYLILEYQGYHNWRNGKYICRLQLDDTYDKVKRRSIIQSNQISFTKITNGYLYKYIICTQIYSGKIHWYMDKYRLYWQNPNKKNRMASYLSKSIHYVFEHNEKQHLPVIQV